MRTNDFFSTDGMQYITPDAVMLEVAIESGFAASPEEVEIGNDDEEYESPGV